MRHSIRCPQCEATFSVRDLSKTSMTRCSACGEYFAVEEVDLTEEVELDAEPQSRRKSRGIQLLIFFSLMLGLGTIVTGFLVLWRDRDQPVQLPRVQFEEPEQRREQIRAALTENTPLQDEELVVELEEFFDLLSEKLRTKDGDQITQLVDVNRLAETLEIDKWVKRNKLRDRQSSLRGLTNGIGQGLERASELFQYDSTSIRHIERLAPNELRVIVLHHDDDDGIDYKFRWWLISNGREWKFYDYEEIELSSRWSVNIQLLLGQLQATPDSLARLYLIRQKANTLHAAYVSLVQGDVEAAEQLLENFDPQDLPAALASQYWVIQAIFAGTIPDGETMLEYCDRANQYNPDMPGLNLLRTQAYILLNRPDDASSSIEKYRQLLGDDAIVCSRLGEIAILKEEFAEAAREFRRALDFHPRDVDSFITLLESLRESTDVDDLPRRFAALGEPREMFDICAQYFVDQGDAVALRHLTRLMRQRDPDYAAVPYHEALAAIWDRSLDDAIPAFRMAIQLETDPEIRQVYTEVFLESVHEERGIMEAYQMLPDRVTSFQILATLLQDSYRTNQLAVLVETHAQSEPNDPLIPFFRGAYLAYEEDYFRADEQFRTGMKNPPQDEDLLARFLNQRVIARAYTSGAVAAYQEIASESLTVYTLAYQLMSWERFDDLDALLNVANAEGPDLLNFENYRLMSLVRQGEYDRAMTRFQKILAEIDDEEEETEWIRESTFEEMVNQGQALRAYRAVPDKVEAFRFLAEELETRKDWDSLLSLIELHAMDHPNDPWLQYYQALHLTHKGGEPDEVARRIFQVWETFPEEERMLIGYSLAGTLARLGHALEAYERIESKETIFWMISSVLRSEEEWDLLGELIERHRPHGKNELWYVCLEAEHAFRKGRVEDAATLLKMAADQQSDLHPSQHFYVNDCVRRLALSGHGLKAYQISPDRASAFNTLATFFTQEEKWDDLEALLTEFEQENPDDPVLISHRAALALGRNDPKEAERLVRISLNQEPGTPSWNLKKLLYMTGAKNGTVTEIYRDFPQFPDSFGELANACLDAKAPRELERLLELRAAERADDPELVYWQVRVAWLDQDYDAVIDQIREDQTGILARPRYSRENLILLTRSLVRLRKAEEAACVWEAARNPSQYMPIELSVLVAAAISDVDGSIQAMAGAHEDPEVIEMLYSDEDLGPILRSAEFERFRAKYPPPQTDAQK